jgi:hypothetical protein
MMSSTKCTIHHHPVVPSQGKFEPGRYVVIVLALLPMMHPRSFFPQGDLAVRMREHNGEVLMNRIEPAGSSKVKGGRSKNNRVEDVTFEIPRPSAGPSQPGPPA